MARRIAVLLVLIASTLSGQYVVTGGGTGGGGVGTVNTGTDNQIPAYDGAGTTLSDADCTFTMDGTNVVVQCGTDSTTGMQYLDADGGTPILNLDTTNERLGIGTASPGATLNVAGNSIFGPSNTTSVGTVIIKDSTPATGVTEVDIQMGAGQDGTHELLELKAASESIFAWRISGSAVEQRTSTNAGLRFTDSGDAITGTPDVGIGRMEAGVMYVTNGSDSDPRSAGNGQLRFRLENESGAPFTCTSSTYGAEYFDTSTISTCTCMDSAGAAAWVCGQGNSGYDQGSDIASAPTINVDGFESARITGITDIDTINTCDATKSSKVLYLIMASTATLKDGTGNMKLAGDQTGDDADGIILLCHFDGTSYFWHQMAPMSAN